MSRPVDFLKGLVGASPSHSSDKIESKQVGKYNHRTAKSVDGKPILRQSKEHYYAEAVRLKKQAGKYRSTYAKELTLSRAQDAEKNAKNAKTNAELHAELDAELEEDAGLAENRRKKQTVPLGQVKSEQAKDAGGRPILEGSREQLMAEVIRCEQRAANCKTKLGQELELKKAHLLKNEARGAKTNAQLHNDKKFEEAKIGMAEARKKRHRGPLDQIKKAAGKVADAIKHEAEEFRNDVAYSIDLHKRSAKIADEREVLKLLTKKKSTLKWYKNPATSFSLWWDIRTQTAKIDNLEKQRR